MVHPPLKSYKVILSNEIDKDLKHIEKPDIKRIFSKIKELQSSVLNLDIKKLKFSKYNLYRLRVGRFRIVYTIKHDKVIIYVVAIGHRKKVYDKSFNRLQKASLD